MTISDSNPKRPRTDNQKPEKNLCSIIMSLPGFIDDNPKEMSAFELKQFFLNFKTFLDYYYEFRNKNNNFAIVYNTSPYGKVYLLYLRFMKVLTDEEKEKLQDSFKNYMICVCPM